MPQVPTYQLLPKILRGVAGSFQPASAAQTVAAGLVAAEAVDAAAGVGLPDKVPHPDRPTLAATVSEIAERPCSKRRYWCEWIMRCSSKDKIEWSAGSTLLKIGFTIGFTCGTQADKLTGISTRFNTLVTIVFAAQKLPPKASSL